MRWIFCLAVGPVRSMGSRKVEWCRSRIVYEYIPLSCYCNFIFHFIYYNNEHIIILIISLLAIIKKQTQKSSFLLFACCCKLIRWKFNRSGTRAVNTKINDNHTTTLPSTITPRSKTNEESLQVAQCHTQHLVNKKNCPLCIISLENSIKHKWVKSQHKV